MWAQHEEDQVDSTACIFEFGAAAARRTATKEGSDQVRSEKPITHPQAAAAATPAAAQQAPRPSRSGTAPGQIDSGWAERSVPTGCHSDTHRVGSPIHAAFRWLAMGHLEGREGGRELLEPMAHQPRTSRQGVALQTMGSSAISKRGSSSTNGDAGVIRCRAFQRCQRWQCEPQERLPAGCAAAARRTPQLHASAVGSRCRCAGKHAGLAEIKTVSAWPRRPDCWPLLHRSG